MEPEAPFILLDQNGPIRLQTKINKRTKKGTWYQDLFCLTALFFILQTNQPGRFLLYESLETPPPYELSLRKIKRKESSAPKKSIKQNGNRKCAFMIANVQMWVLTEDLPKNHELEPTHRNYIIKLCRPHPQGKRGGKIFQEVEGIVCLPKTETKERLPLEQTFNFNFNPPISPDGTIQEQLGQMLFQISFNWPEPFWTIFLSRPSNFFEEEIVASSDFTSSSGWFVTSDGTPSSLNSDVSDVSSPPSSPCSLNGKRGRSPSSLNELEDWPDKYAKTNVESETSLASDFSELEFLKEAYAIPFDMDFVPQILDPLVPESL